LIANKLGKNVKLRSFKGVLLIVFTVLGVAGLCIVGTWLIYSSGLESTKLTADAELSGVAGGKNEQLLKSKEAVQRVNAVPNPSAASKELLGQVGSSISRLVASNPLNPDGLAASLAAENIISGEAEPLPLEFSNSQYVRRRYEFKASPELGVYRFSYDLLESETEPSDPKMEQKYLESLEVVFGYSPKGSENTFEQLSEKLLEDLNNHGGQVWSKVKFGKTFATFVNEKKESLWLKMYSPADLPDNPKDPFHSIVLGYTPARD
jgi:hypothetical protein